MTKYSLFTVIKQQSTNTISETSTTRASARQDNNNTQQQAGRDGGCKSVILPWLTDDLNHNMLMCSAVSLSSMFTCLLF